VELRGSFGDKLCSDRQGVGGEPGARVGRRLKSTGYCTVEGHLCDSLEQTGVLATSLR
jgi:hypothetical protein